MSIELTRDTPIAFLVEYIDHQIDKAIVIDDAVQKILDMKIQMVAQESFDRKDTCGLFEIED